MKEGREGEREGGRGREDKMSGEMDDGKVRWNKEVRDQETYGRYNLLCSYICNESKLEK